MWGAPTQMPFMPPMPQGMNDPLLSIDPFLPNMMQYGGSPAAPVQQMFAPQYQTQYPNYTPAGVMDWGNYLGGFK
jgi:hypothetical protein